MLKIQFTDNRQDPFWMMEKTFSIGRADDNDLVIDDASIGAHHAKIQKVGENFILKDLGETTGTQVNSQRINKKPVACGDEIKLGDVVLEIVDPIEQLNASGENYWAIIADSSWLLGQEFPLRNDGKPVVIGRGSQCDLVFPGTHLSRQHAEITVKDDHLVLRDLNSANGSFINDKQITAAKVRPGDRIRLDVYSFKVFGPGIQLPKSSTARQRALSQTDLDLRESMAQSKQWKTRSTSPGNREEPVSERTQKIISWVVAGGITAFAIAVVIMLFA